MYNVMYISIYHRYQRCYSVICLLWFKCLCIYLQFWRKIWHQSYTSSSLCSWINAGNEAVGDACEILWSIIKYLGMGRV